MSLKNVLVCFIAIIISLAFATYDFSGVQYGSILNIFGYVSLIAILIGFVIKNLKS